MCVYVCVCVHMSVSLWLCMCVSLGMSVYVCLYVSVCVGRREALAA